MQHFDLVDSGSELVRTIVTEIADIVSRQAGKLHPGLRIVETAGHFSVHCTRGESADADTLIVVPRDLLVPLDELAWSERTDRLALTRPDPRLTPVQQRLLALHIDLYNATDKLDWWCNRHPGRLAMRDGAIRDALREIRPGFEAEQPATTAAGFLESRALWLKRGGGRQRPVLMPLVDLINHHHRGSPIALDASTLSVAASQPEGGSECFADYGGRRDVIGLALHHGYLDRSTPFAHVAPLRLRTADLGEIELLAEARQPAHAADPPEVTIDEGRITLSHLCCDLDHPDRARAVLRLALARAARLRGLKTAEAQHAATRAIGAILTENLGRLAALTAACQQAVPAFPQAQVLAMTAERQAQILRAVLR